MRQHSRKHPGLGHKRPKLYMGLALGLVVILSALVPGLLLHLGKPARHLQDGVSLLVEAHNLSGEIGPSLDDGRLIAIIRDKDAPSRLLAIEALGIGQSGHGLPVLTMVVHDVTEPASHRIAALRSILNIASHQAIALAETYREDPVLGETSQALLADVQEAQQEPPRAGWFLEVLSWWPF